MHDLKQDPEYIQLATPGESTCLAPLTIAHIRGWLKEPGMHFVGTGRMTGTRKLFTKKEQRPLASFDIEISEGSISAIILPAEYYECGHHLQDDATLTFEGIMTEKYSGTLELQVLEIRPSADNSCDPHQESSPRNGLTPRQDEKSL